MYLGLVWAAAPGQEGLGDLGRGWWAGRVAEGPVSQWQCQGRVLPDLSVCFWGEGMCKWGDAPCGVQSAGSAPSPGKR